MKVSFIVITYHRGPLLQQCLESIYAQADLPRPFEVIVVDNGGDVDLADSGEDIRLVLVKPDENLGVAAGRNLGMKSAQGEYWIFLDDDATWHDQYDASRLVTHLDNDAACAGVAIKILDPRTDQAEVSLFTHPDKNHISARTESIPVPYYYGGGHILRAEAVRKVGLYPERFFYAMEEIDLCLRLIDAGYHLLYDPAVAAYHHTDQTGRIVFGEKYWKRNSLNKSRVAWRLLPHPYPLTTMLIWSIATLVKTRNPLAVWEIWRELWRERTLLRAEREPIQTTTVNYLKKIGARLWY